MPLALKRRALQSATLLHPSQHPDPSMAEGTTKVVSLTELLQTCIPRTGTSSLPLNSPFEPNDSVPTDSIPNPSLPTTTGNPNNSSNFIKPLNHPTMLIGTLTLPSPQTNATSTSNPCSNPSCLQFSDGSATVCCDILDLDFNIIGKKIHVLAWNFIPMKSGGGFLEIIRCVLPDSCAANNPVNGFSLDLGVDAAFIRDTSYKAQNLVYGLVESVSPVSHIPCSTSGQRGGDTRKVTGFLTRIWVCECKLCYSRDTVIDELLELGEENSSHNFTDCKIVYFCGSASCWQPAVSRLIGKLVLLSGLKKKLVFIGNQESQQMYVTTEKSMLRLPMPLRKQLPSRKNKGEGKGECQVYTGCVTGSYMQGMVTELDRTVLLLLTDHQLSLPHSLRVGSVVTVRSVHLVNPKYAWTNVLIFGACFRSSFHVNVFSPMQTRCYQLLQSHSLLRKFLDCLTFSARLWALLVVSSLRKKFAGKLSEKEILGSKHDLGMAQKYSNSHLPLSAFEFRHGVFTEFCRHDLCCCGNELKDNPLKLVVPISNFVNHCEATFMKMIFARETNFDIKGCKNQDRFASCEGQSYYQPIRRVLKSEDINVVLLGNLKISQESGRLQLIDATGSIDIVIPDLPSVWSINEIFEITDFNIVMEGIPEELDLRESIATESFSCRSIFNSSQSVGEVKFDIYVYCYLRNVRSKNHPLYHSKDTSDKFKDLESGEFHLLWVTHKFPVLQKFPGDKVVSNKLNTYAEALILPWNLVLTNKDGVTPSTKISQDQLRDPNESYGSRYYREHVPFKRCKTEHPSKGTLTSGSNDSGNIFWGHLTCRSSTSRRSYDELACGDMACPHEIPCSIASRINIQQLKADARKVLLEFTSDSLSKYELLRIGSCYMMKRCMENMVYAVTDSQKINDGKVVIGSKSHLWGISLCTDEAHTVAGQSCIPSYDILHVSNKQIQSENSHQVEIPVLRSNDGCPEISSDFYLHLPADALSLLEADLKTLKEDFTKPFISLKEVAMSASVQSLGNSNLRLPEGNLLSLHGDVVAVHNSGRYSLAECVGPKSAYNVLRHQSLKGATSTVCIHLFVDNTTVKIISGLRNTQHAFPIGFGPGVNATFHRILVISGEDALILTPASFIVINSVVVVDHQYDKSDDTPVSTVVNAVKTGMATLICEIKQSLDCQPVQLNCKVVAVYVLIMEKKDEVLHPHSRIYSGVPSVNFPLAGFVLDDGSSSFCCWANSERVATLLCLCEGLALEASGRSLWKSKECLTGGSYSHNIARMDKILDWHGRIVVKNYGSVYDSSWQDLAISVDSDVVVSSSDEELLKLIILNACFSPAWNVVASMMDLEAVKQLENRLQELDMKMLPLPNFWAAEVTRTDPLAEGKNVLQELLKSR